MLWPKEEAEAVTAQPSPGRRGRPGQRPVTLGPFREVKGEPQTLGPQGAAGHWLSIVSAGPERAGSPQKDLWVKSVS